MSLDYNFADTKGQHVQKNETYPQQYLVKPYAELLKIDLLLLGLQHTFSSDMHHHRSEIL